MAFKRKFDSDFPDGMLKVLQQLDNPPLEEAIINQVAEGLLPEMNTEDSNVLWTTLSENLKKCFRTIVSVGDMEAQGVEGFFLKKIDAYPFMRTLLYLLKMAIQLKAENSIPSSAAHTMLILSSLLKNIKTNGQAESEMVPAGELWLERKLMLQNDWCARVFHEMLIKSLRADAVEADISDVYNMQEWLCASDIQKNSWPFVTLAMKNTNFLKTSVGRSFLAFGMTLDTKLTEDLHKVCKSHLPLCSEAEANSYGLIYLEAWRLSNIAMRKVIEEQCICDLMNCVLTLPRKGMKMSSFGISILNLLHEFHTQRSCKNVCDMLSSKYDLCLWHCLKDQSIHVRCNALEVLTDAYPLEKPNLSVMDNNKYLSKQRNIMSDLLNDANSYVRGVAVREICSLMTKFWAYIPPSIIQHWISTIILQLKYSREPESKRILYQGLHTLVMNPNQSYTRILEKMLPDLQDQITDNDLSVRVAFVELLLAIKNKGDIKFWNIVPLQHLITRLEEDESEVCELLVQLLHSTYFARNRQSHAVINCITDMIQLSFQGTRKFFLHSESVIKFDAAIKLILQIMEHLLKHIQEYYFKQRLIKDFSQTRGRHVSHKKWRNTVSRRRVPVYTKKVWLKAVRSTRIVELVSSTDSSEDETEIFSIVDNTSSSETEEETDVYEKYKFRNPQVCQGLLDVVSILFYVHSAKRKGKPICKQWLRVYRICKQCIPLFALYFAGSCAFDSVLVLASMVPMKLLKTIHMSPDVEALWKRKLRLLSFGDDSDEIIHLASFIWLKDCGKTVFTTAANVFSTAIASRIDDATFSLKKPRDMLLKYESDSLLKFKILRAAFTNFPYRTRIVAQNSKYMLDTWKSMEQIKRLVEIRLQNVMCFKDPVAGDRFIMECFSCYVKLIPVLTVSSTSEFNNTDEYFKLLDWANNVLLLGLPEKSPYENERSHFEWIMIETTGPLTISLLSNLLEILPIMMEMEYKISVFIYKAVRLCKRVLRTGCRLLFVPPCITFLWKLFTYCQKKFAGNTLQKTLHMIAHLLMDCISGFSDGIPLKNYLKPAIEGYENVEYSIGTTLHTLIKFCGTSSTMIVNVVCRFIDVILTTVDKGDFMLKGADLRDVEDLPFIACRFVNIFTNSDSLSGIFLETFVRLVSESNAQIWQLIASTKLIHILVYCPGILGKESLKSAVRSIELAVRGHIAQSDTVTLHEINLKVQPTMDSLFKSMKQHLAIS